MINDANIDLAGFVASEPSFKRLATGTSTAKLRVAYTEPGWPSYPKGTSSGSTTRPTAGRISPSLSEAQPSDKPQPRKGHSCLAG